MIRYRDNNEPAPRPAVPEVKDVQRADEFFAPKRKSPKPASDLTAIPPIDRDPKIPFSGETEKVSIRLAKEYVDIAKGKREKMSDVVSSAMAQYYRLMGWL